MIQLTTTQKGGNLYLVYDLANSAKQIDDISVMMINSNQKSNIGLAKISFEEMNGEKQRILFDITGMMPLAENLRQNQSQKSFRNMILALVWSIEHLDEFMIDLHSLIFDMNYVYINPVTRQVRFICLPFTEPETGAPTPYEFFRNICAVSNVEAVTGETSYFNLVLNVLSNPSAFSVSNLREALAPELSEPVKPISRKEVQNIPQEVLSSQPNESGDVTFVPNPEFQRPAAPVPAFNSGKGDSGADKMLFQMPEPDKKDDKSLLGKFKKKFFNKKDSDTEKQEGGFSGGLAGLSAKPAAPAAPAPAPAVNPVPQFAAPSAPAPAPSASAPVNAPAESNRTIFVAPGNKPAAVPEFGGLAGINARTNQVQQDLFAEPAGGVPAAGVQLQGGSGILGGGMTGEAPQGLPPMQQPAPAPTPAPISAPVQNDDPKTVVMLPDQGADDRTVRMEDAWLIRQKDNSRIRLDKPLIRVGRNRDDIDINLPDNLHVGHMHATLLKVGGDYVVIDNNSANHTYVNHMRIEAQQQHPLKDGDKVSFADEEFEYHIGL